ncbi:esterase/lipase family protein [Sphingobium subterraneum]|uniref:Pimeloyl-ACP methyl ester carboxylesterase n=1 Tax=Sphingobium subterraneum TaxID=627688 RepID=A0A841IUA4_9SPHN|nr:alpha/beta fold hydrolase [Sphingobium subterraneum]MBB6122499.1 pimeloyl-ACP methyl ester carboxylesterase [Sphingobium subterraneum]
MTASQPVALLLHGWMSHPVAWAALARDLRTNGYRVEAPFYPSRRLPLSRIAARLAQWMTVQGLESAPRLDIIGHSMGGLVARALIATHRPPNLGSVVMLGTPNAGSEIADWLNTHPAGRMLLGRAAPVLVTRREEWLLTHLGPVDYPLGVIAGSQALFESPFTRNLPKPHDGKVSVAATHLEGQSDHIVLPITHSMLPFHRASREQALHFLAQGAFH